jgi:hypothetical protein
VSIVRANVNFDDLTNHIEDLRRILATNEVKHTKGLLIRTHPHKQIFGDVGDVVVVTYLRSHGVPEELVQHPTDGLHPMSGAKLNVAISTIIHKSHLAVKRDLSTTNLLTTKIL